MGGMAGCRISHRGTGISFSLLNDIRTGCKTRDELRGYSSWLALEDGDCGDICEGGGCEGRNDGDTCTGAACDICDNDKGDCEVCAGDGGISEDERDSKLASMDLSPSQQIC